MAASAGLLSALTLAQPARAETCTAQASDCPGVEQVLTAFARSASTDATAAAAATNSVGGVASTQAVAPLAATTAAVTDYISVSDNVVQGTRTSASNALNAMAIGPTAAATGSNAVAVGAGSAAGSDASTAVGAAAGALSINSTAIGAGTTVGVLSDNSVAIGYNARSSALNSMSIGSFASATSAGAVAIGYNVFVAQAATNSLSLGSNSSVSAANSVALGSGSVADRANVVAVGNATQNRQIVSVADGARATDAVNVGQLSRVANALGGGASIDANGAMVAPVYTVGTATYSDVGSALAAAVTAGVQASTDSVQYDSTAHDVVTLGHSGTPVKLTNVAAANLGSDSSDAVNGGQLFATNQVVAENTSNITNLDQRVTDNTSSITNLDQRVTDNTSSITNLDQRVTDNTSNITNLDQRVTDNTSSINNLDTRTTTIEGDVTNITNQITKGEIGLVQQDDVSRNLSVAKDTDGARVDFGGTSGARELTGVAAGTTDSSAVNLGQLKPVAAALGGGAQINADGSFTAPTYHMQGGTQSTVGDALGSLDSGLSTLQQNMANGGIGVVTQDPVTRAINVGATMDGSLVNMAGTAGKRVVTGVASGAVGAASSDAVNGSQLYGQAASTAVALGGGSTVAADGTVSAPSYSVNGAVVNDVGSAITNLDTRTTKNSTDIASLQTTVSSFNGSVANAVQYDSAAHDRITLGGTSAGASKVTLTNLQAGEISATSSDAVTGAQLWQTNQQVTNITQTVQNFQSTGDAYVSVNSAGNAAQAIGNGSVAIGGGAQASAPNSVAIGEGSVADQSGTVSVGSSGNERRITNVGAGQAPTDAVNMQQFQGGMNEIARNAYSGTASAIALTMVPEVDTSKNLAIGVATAGYKGYQAVAVGFSARVTPSLKVKIGAGISAATTTVGAGAAYQW